MSDAAQLLERHLPYLKYDSHEAFFADAADIFTVDEGMRLRRAGSATDIATAGHGLSLAFLSHPERYPGTDIVPAGTDTLGVPDKRYRARAAALHAIAAYRNVVYGHVVVDDRGATWLQYWYFYYYNDYNLLGALMHAGRHEGDWEMVQVRLGADGRPDLAVYAQHAEAQGRPWDQVETVPGTERPVVYVARGSHAAYFEPGTQPTRVWVDHADGKRQSPPRQRLVAVVDGDAALRWVRWPGRWGDTPRRGGIAPADSPRSPGVRAHWRDPLVLLETAALAALAAPPPRPPLPAPPSVTVRRGAGETTLGWSVAALPDGTQPALLTLTINSKDDAAPPATTNHAIDAPAGTLALPPLDPAKRYDLFVSDATADGRASDSVRRDLPALA